VYEPEHIQSYIRHS